MRRGFAAAVTVGFVVVGRPEWRPDATATGSAHQADPSAPSGQCPAASLAVSLGTDQGGGAAGSFYYDLAFTNTGSASCVLRGFPGLSIVGAENGTQLGVAAARTNTPVANVILSPGGVAKAQFRLVDVGALPTCQIVSGDGFRVYPPHLTQAFFVKAAGVQACSNADQVFLYVDAVAAG